MSTSTTEKSPCTILRFKTKKNHFNISASYNIIGISQQESDPISPLYFPQYNIPVDNKFTPLAEFNLDTLEYLALPSESSAKLNMTVSANMASTTSNASSKNSVQPRTCSTSSFDGLFQNAIAGVITHIDSFIPSTCDLHT